MIDPKTIEFTGLSHSGSVEREEKREAFRQDTLKAWEEYRATGLHVTADEADAWLAQLEQGNDIEPPECAY